MRCEYTAWDVTLATSSNTCARIRRKVTDPLHNRLEVAAGTISFSKTTKPLHAWTTIPTCVMKSVDNLRIRND